MSLNSSTQTFHQFFSSLGFDDNPFAYTNADQEERLSSYFIPPPYFNSVFGNPEQPRSFIVFAPRGGGKSAQRIMIEHKCVDNEVLAITYDQFEFPDIAKATDVKLHHHLRRILRFSLVGLLVNLHSDPLLEEQLTKEEKQIFLKLAAEHLCEIKGADLEIALNSLKSFKDKFKDFWNEWIPAIGPGIKALSSLMKPIADLGDIGGLAKYQDPEFKSSKSLKYQLRLTVDLAHKLGWKCIYILVDRVDESSLTGNSAKDSFALLEPLLRDLQLLEFPGIGFKFFLWDLLQSECERVVRTDRIDLEILDWDKDMLKRLWEKRLCAFSREQISSLEQISTPTSPYTIDDLAFTFANHSPRDMIRIGGKILSEQQELDPFSKRVDELAIYRGIEKFCSQRAAEIITKSKVLQELKKVRQVDFTIPYLANEVFREKQASTRSRMVVWRQQAAIIEVERIDDPRSKQKLPVKLFAIKDIRVAKEIYPELDTSEFLKRKYRRCPNCDATVLRDWGDSDSSNTCHDCRWDLSGQRDDVEGWRRKELATRRRRQYREETLDSEAIQLSFLDNDSLT